MPGGLHCFRMHFNGSVLIHPAPGAGWLGRLGLDLTLPNTQVRQV